MPSTNAERLKIYKGRMKQAGFQRVSVWVHPDLINLMAANRKPSDCGGRVLERLLLGDAKQRPAYYDIDCRTSTRDTCAHDSGNVGVQCDKYARNVHAPVRGE